MAERLGIVSWTPLWHQNSLEHMQGLVKNGFRIFITGVSCEGLDNSWIGHTLTAESLAQLELLSKKYRFNVDGEGGEFETLVVGGPHLPGHLELSGEVDWDGIRGVRNFVRSSNCLTSKCDTFINNFSSNTDVISRFKHCFEFFCTECSHNFGSTATYID